MAVAPLVNRGGTTTYKGRDGKEYILDLRNDTTYSPIYGIGGTFSDGYRFNNLFRSGNAWDLSNSIQTMLDLGRIPSKAEIQEHTGIELSEASYRNILYDLDVFLKKNNLNLDDYTNTVQEAIDANKTEQEKAYEKFNDYYTDTYSLNDGTTGKAIYDSLLEAERQNAISNMQLADAQQQYSAMQQAETVKMITDQVKAERMEKLRAGMSEAQIANTEMQTLMNNVNTLNQQAQQYNLARLQAQQQYDNAQHTAYQQWLTNANTMAQIGAANTASDAGDLYQQARRISKALNIPLEQAIGITQGNKQ